MTGLIRLRAYFPGLNKRRDWRAARGDALGRTDHGNWNFIGLDLRYERLRVRQAARERHLLVRSSRLAAAHAARRSRPGAELSRAAPQCGAHAARRAPAVRAGRAPDGARRGEVPRPVGACHRRQLPAAHPRDRPASAQDLPRAEDRPLAAPSGSPSGVLECQTPARARR